MLNDHRVGRFQIGLDVINDAPEIVTRIMGETIIIRAEMVLALNAIEYHAICEHFEELPDWLMPPEYDVIYDGETDKITWAKSE